MLSEHAAGVRGGTEVRRRSPSHYARWCRAECGLDDVESLDLYQLAEGRAVEVRVAPLSSIEGAALVEEGAGAVCINEDQGHHRFRFTFGHELGHLFLPWHYHLLTERGILTDKHVRWGRAKDLLEREANDFAAELLTPGHLVKPQLRRGNLDLARAVEISERFDVSLTSAALRITELSRAGLAVLLFSDGKLRWRFGNEHFPYGLPDSGTLPPPGTVTSDVIAGGGDLVNADPVDAEAWLVLRQFGGYPELLESSLRLGQTGMVLTVLWSPT